MALPYGLESGMKSITVTTDESGTKTEWVAGTTPHSIVFRKNGKPTKTDEVPEKVKENLLGTLMAGVTVKAKTDINPADSLEAVEEIGRVAEQIEQTPNENWQPSPLENVDSIADELIAQGEDTGFTEADEPEIDVAAELEMAMAMSIERVNLRELATALYRRFGIYSVYLNRPPKSSDISPVTGAVMNAFSLGQTHQNFKAAQRLGTSWNPAVIKAQIRTAESLRGDVPSDLPDNTLRKNQVVGEQYGNEIKMPTLHGEATPEQERPRYNRHYESPHKSAMYSERGKESDGLDSDEVYASPPINARNSIIRPFINNERTQSQLEQISKTRTPKQQDISFEDLV